MRCDPLGDSALLVRLDDVETPDSATIDALLAAADQLRAANIAGVIELAPAYKTLAVFYRPEEVRLANAEDTPFSALQRSIAEVLTRSVSRRKTERRRVVEIPVCYDSEFAPDLGVVAEHAGCTVAQVAEQHAAAEYRVGCVGFTPGFPYLVGLPPQLATPRRAAPRKQVAAGSVAIGGSQTGIYPVSSPGGWNIIGRTPLRLFDVTLDPPSLLGTGDAVRFRAITRAEFDAFG